MKTTKKLQIIKNFSILNLAQKLLKIVEICIDLYFTHSNIV